MDPFVARALADVRPGARILDVGSGARPAIAPEQRPAGCHYAGLDIARAELERAAPGAYDELLVGDICQRVPATEGRFEVVVSWQVLEHVSSMADALATKRRALVPGGRMVAMLSGGWSMHAVAARVIPYRVSTWLQTRLLGSTPDDKFPTVFDGCSDRALRRLLADGGWAFCEVVPLYRSGNYLEFMAPLQRAYLAYENWAARGPRANLATHYIVDAIA
ncbi:MAG: methyltransferase domain-containing protein [Solirubrobacteraceae bacterium]